MKRACAWCGKELPPNDMKPAPDLPPDAVSHGMCEQCKEQLGGHDADYVEEPPKGGGNAGV